MKELFNRIDSLNDGTWQSLVLFYAVKIAIAVLILLIGFWIINRVVRILNRAFNNKRLDHTVTTFFKTLINAGLKIILVLFILNFIGIQTTSIVALVGAAGLAIGLALQGTLTNLAGGVMLLIFKPFREGDYVEAQGKKGKVTDIQIFSTILIDDKNSRIIIPNSVLSNGIIENHGKALPKEEKPTEPAIKKP
jgi:small conductance mechanosensitive channel